MSAAPPIPSIILAFLACFLLFHKQLRPIARYLVNGSTYEYLQLGVDGEIKWRFGSGLTCEEIKSLFDESENRDELLEDIAIEISADSFAKLVECDVISLKTDKKFLNRFSDWELFSSKYPELFEVFGEGLELEDMESSALKSLPVNFILKRFEQVNKSAMLMDLMNKLPLKKILKHLLDDRTTFLSFWKLFNRQIFMLLEREEKNFFMSYLSALGLNDAEDIILLLIRTEEFLIEMLKDLNDVKVWNESDYDWIVRFEHVQMIVEQFIDLRKKLISGPPIINEKLLLAPVSKKLRDALKEVITSKGHPSISGLAKALLIPKPIDYNLYPDEIKPIKRPVLKDILLNFYRVDGLFRSFHVEEFGFVEDSVLFLEIMRVFSDDEDLILASIPKNENVYTEVFPVSEWIRKALEIGSYKLLNLFYSNYKLIFKPEIARIISEAKEEEVIKNIVELFVESSEAELKYFLLLPSSRGEMEKVLELDFIDDSELGLSSTLELKREYIAEAFEFYRKELRSLQQGRLTVKFREMIGQDTGGIARHFLMIIFRLLIDDNFGLFHARKDDGQLVSPRTLLDANILGFVGMLHGQALKLGLKLPWLIDFDMDNQPIRICQVIKEMETNSETGLVPTGHDIIIYLNEQLRICDRFDLSLIPETAQLTSEYLKMLEFLEVAFWRAGQDAYKSNLLGAIDRELLDCHVVFDEILNLLRPLKSSQIDPNEFMKCFRFRGEAKDLIERVVRKVISSDPVEMIPATLKFVTGSIELPPAGMASLNLAVNTFLTENRWERRLPQASTCHKIVNWHVSRDEREDELMERFRIAVKDSQGFELA